LPWADTKQCAGKFLTCPSLFTIGIVSNTYAFTLSFVVSHFPVVCGIGRGGAAKDTANNLQMISVLGGAISILVL
jgi:hypothetical protein